VITIIIQLFYQGNLDPVRSVWYMIKNWSQCCNQFVSLYVATFTYWQIFLYILDT